MPGTEDRLAEVRKEFHEAKAAWSDIRDQIREDQKFLSGNPQDQWDTGVAQARKNSSKPVLTFGTLHTTVQSISNQARKNRPEIKVEPGDDDANPQTADMLEGNIRQIQYDSHASIAYDYAEECAVGSSIGWIRITTEYESPRSLNQVPRIKRVFDTMSVFPVGKIEEPDFSDMKRCFVRQTMSVEEYRKRFKRDPISFERDQDEFLSDWRQNDGVTIAEYWHIEEQKRRLLFLQSRGPVFEDEFPKGTKFPESDILGEREVIEPLVYCDLIDGARVLQTDDWLGNWIPLIPVLGKQQVVMGKMQLLSAIRFARDPARLLNSTESNIALMLGLQSKTPWLGYVGQFKNKKWKDSNTEDYAYLESEIISLPGGGPAPLPTRGAYEAPIQGLIALGLQARDGIKAAVGYVDTQLRPSQSDISGVAVERRNDQVELANFHFEDNLTEIAQWHIGRQLIDLIPKLVDTPRMLRARSVNGKTSMHPVMPQAGMGHAALVEGHENEPHHRLDTGQYHPVIQSGPGYARKKDEERDVLLKALQQDPALWPQYADVLFELMGYPDLAERAKMLLPPQLQQAISDGAQQIPPEVRAKIVQLSQENGALKQGIQKLMAILQGKQVEQQGKLSQQRLKTAGDIMLKEMDIKHDVGKTLFEGEQAAIEHITSMLHESELAPDPNQPPEEGTVQ